MTMHLARGLTMINTKKRKQKTKFTKIQIEKWSNDLREHNKRMRQAQCHNQQMNLEEYIDYVHGRYKSKTNITPQDKPWHYSEPYRRTTEEFPSYSSKESFAPCTKKEPLRYTGERKLVGIATMHKSNMVPVFADDEDKTGKKQATELAQMRRN